MKPQRVLFALILATGLLLTNVAPALAVPPMPSSFYGTVLEAGVNVPVGTPVTAWINGVQYAATTTIMNGGVSVYSLDVPGDEDGTVPVEGGVPGDTVVFHVNDLVADQTAPWQSGTNVELNLTVTPLPEY